MEDVMFENCFEVKFLDYELSSLLF
jgi:hypothetical protein